VLIHIHDLVPDLDVVSWHSDNALDEFLGFILGIFEHHNITPHGAGKPVRELIDQDMLPNQ